MPVERAALPAWLLPATIAFALVELTNIALEEFVGLPGAWSAIVPGAVMGLIVLVAATAALRASVVGAVVLLEGGMAVASAVVVLGVAIARPAELARTVTNAALHLALLPLVAVIAGGTAIAIARGTRRRAWVSAAGLPVLAAGVALLVHMSGLPRAERPPFVMAGFGLAAAGLVLLPCAAARSLPTRGDER